MAASVYSEARCRPFLNNIEYLISSQAPLENHTIFLDI
jgi:hypothetical protein